MFSCRADPKQHEPRRELGERPQRDHHPSSREPEEQLPLHLRTCDRDVRADENQRKGKLEKDHCPDEDRGTGAHDCHPERIRLHLSAVTLDSYFRPNPALEAQDGNDAGAAAAMKISEHCFAITGLGFTAPWEVNAGFVLGGRSTLVVDTGPSYLAARTIYGYASNVRPGNALIAVNTELHVDHLLGNSLFEEMSVPIWGHEKCERTADALDLNVAEFNRTVPEVARRQRNEAAIFFGGSRIVNPEHRISTEKQFDLGGVVAKVIPAPGHSPANMLVHVAADAVLYSGDTVVAGYLPNLEGGGLADWKQWLSALGLVRRLAPGVLVPGHGCVLEGSEIEMEVTRLEEILREAIG